MRSDMRNKYYSGGLAIQGSNSLDGLTEFCRRAKRLHCIACRKPKRSMASAKETAPDFQPYIAAETHLQEGTFRAIITGTILGMIFGASSLYLALKVGLTVSASIPVAVISITLYRVWGHLGQACKDIPLIGRFLGGRDATILEHNIMQTAGSAGESLAFGVGATLPAMLILGFDLDLTQTLLVTALGGLLGILMMIPLRRALVVAQHGSLKFRECRACGECLKA